MAEWVRCSATSSWTQILSRRWQEKHPFIGLIRSSRCRAASSTYTNPCRSFAEFWVGAELGGGPAEWACSVLQYE